MFAQGGAQTSRRSKGAWKGAHASPAWGRMGDRPCDPAAYGGVRLRCLDIERNKKPQLSELQSWSDGCPR
jgi:hypothetical protein